MNTPTFNCLVTTAYQSWIDSRLTQLDTIKDISQLSDEAISDYLKSQVESASLEHTLAIQIHDGYMSIDYPGFSLNELVPLDATDTHNPIETYVVSVLESLSDSQYNELYENFSLSLNQTVSLDPDKLLDLIANYGE